MRALANAEPIFSTGMKHALLSGFQEDIIETSRVPRRYVALYGQAIKTSFQYDYNIKSHLKVVNNLGPKKIFYPQV